MKNIDKIVGGLLNDNQESKSPVERRRDFYKEGLHGRELKKVEGEWVSLEGAKFVTRDFGEISEHESDDAYGQNVPVGRENQVGTFDSNGGSIVYVDGEGKAWMAPFTTEAQQALIDAGYQGKSIAVPHMFDMQTRFKDEGMHKKWLELSKKAGVEGKDFPIKDDEMKV